jgi:uncharacterized protein YqgC (DUF456 family)
MHTEPLDALPLWSLFLATIVLTGLTMEAGYRYGAWRHRRIAEEKETSVGTMVGSIMGLLAFLLAFTFSFAAARFDTRRALVLEEANAIGTTYLRAQFLPEPQRTQAAARLREYVDVRVRGVQESKTAEAIARSEELHELLWAQAVAASANKEGIPVMTGLFAQSLNDVIDVHAKRVQAGARSRIPVTIWAVLFGLALLSMGGVGYHAGLSGTRRSPAMPGMVLAFAAVLFLIADLDRPREGFLVVNQQAMLDLQKSMQPTKP